MNRIMKRRDIKHIAMMRIVVSYLGEKGQYGWWPSGFWAPTADAFLSPVFPRSIFMAKANGASAAAKKLHDERIGVGRVFHLFRLPEDLEQAIHSAVHSEQTVKDALPLVVSQQSAEDFLAANCGSTDEVENVGPVVCGEIAELLSAAVAESVAGAYLSGFRGGHKVFPYLTEAAVEAGK
jgi:hypothetical protein